MKLTTILLALTSAASAVANPHHGQGDWKPPGHGDFRGPCPMMNTLANHGFLPRDGKDLTRDTVVMALGSALNFNQSLSSLMFDMAIIANPEPNATFFTLDHLNRHNVLEHDSSLSRSDAYFGNNHIFNQTIFDQSKVYWSKPILTAEMLANSKLARQIESRAFNPTYTFTKDTENFSLGEIAAPIIVFGDTDLGQVNRTLVEYFFVNERLPIEMGWHKKEDLIGIDDVLKVSGMIEAATSLLTDSKESQSTKRRDLHAGLNLEV